MASKPTSSRASARRPRSAEQTPAAPLDPARGQPLVLGGHHERPRRQPPVLEEIAVGRRDDAHRVEGGIHQLDQLRTLLGHPVGTGEAEVARADMQHLDDVLRLQDLGLEALQRQGRAVAAAVEGQADAGVGQQAHDVLLHPALGQGEMDGAGIGSHRGRHDGVTSVGAALAQRRRSL